MSNHIFLIFPGTDLVKKKTVVIVKLICHPENLNSFTCTLRFLRADQ